MEKRKELWKKKNNPKITFLITKITRSDLNLNFYIEKLDDSEFLKNHICSDGCYNVENRTYHLFYKDNDFFRFEEDSYSLSFTGNIKRLEKVNSEELIKLDYPLKVLHAKYNYRMYDLENGNTLSFIICDDICSLKYNNKIMLQRYVPSTFTFFKHKYPNAEKIVVYSTSKDSPDISMFGDKIYTDNWVYLTCPSQQRFYVASDIKDYVIKEFEKQGYRVK